jgi:hypothetical protein
VKVGEKPILGGRAFYYYEGGVGIGVEKLPNGREGKRWRKVGSIDAGM